MVVAPATATATNENQDNDNISNNAQNAGGKRKKRKKRDTKYPTMRSILYNLFAKLSSFLCFLYSKEDFSSTKNDNLL